MLEVPEPVPVPPPVLEMTDLTVTLMEPMVTELITGIDWRVDPGDFWVVAGLPGSGKTQLLATAQGLQAPTRGTHRLFGRDVAEFKETDLQQARLRLGLVFQGGSRLFANLTVAENIALPVCYHRNIAPEAAASTVDAILDLTGLTRFAAVTPGRLPRAWRHRVGLARALALRPEALLLDDPLVGLDFGHARWWLDLLQSLWRGAPFLGHRLTVALTCSDLRPFLARDCRFALIRDQRFVVVGDRQALDASHEPVLKDLLTDGAEPP